MPRLAAILLASIFSFLLVAPGSYISRESQLPACCRANGKHQCMMGTANTLQADDGISGMSVRGVCPYAGAFHLNRPTPGRTLGCRVSTLLFSNVINRPVVQAQIEALGRISFNRSRQKRGPPFLFS